MRAHARAHEHMHACAHARTTGVLDVARGVRAGVATDLQNFQNHRLSKYKDAIDRVLTKSAQSTDGDACYRAELPNLKTNA